jgi:hypothetical protein
VVELWLGLRALDFANGEPVNQGNVELSDLGVPQ